MQKRDFNIPGPIRTNRQISQAEQDFGDSGGFWPKPKRPADGAVKPTLPSDHNDGGRTAD